MQLITLNSQVNSDGLLQLQLPDEFKNHHVTVTIRPESPEWLSVLQKTAGTIPDLERPSQGKQRQPFGKFIEELVSDIPPDILESLPTDGAEQHDHYIYGTPISRLTH